MAKITPKKQIRDAAKDFRKIMRRELGAIADDLIDQVMKRARKLTPANRLKAIKDLNPRGVRAYKTIVQELMGALAVDAINNARKEIPGTSKVKLSELDNLQPELKKKLKVRSDLLVDKQIGDLLKVIEFAYITNQDTTDSDNIVEDEISDSAVDWLDGTAVTAGAELTAATVISDARDVFFDTPDVSKEIEAFQFVNGDPKTAICRDLAGTIFAKDDPNRFRYTPPLHWNCKSYIKPIVTGKLNGREIKKLKPSTKRIEDTIQFDENHETFCACCT